MKKWLILIGLVLLIFGGAYFALSYYAVKFIQGRLERLTGPGLTFSGIEVKPTYLSAKGIRYEDPQLKQVFLTVEEMRVYPDLFASLKGAVRLREWVILRPSFFFKRSKEGDFSGPWVEIERAEKEKGGKKEARGERSVFQIEIDRLRIENGSVDFLDEKTEGPPAQIELRELDFQIGHIQYPVISRQSSVELKGKMKGRMKDGTLYAKGWIDLGTSDMEMSFKARGVEVKTFQPYYQQRASAEIESGDISLEAKIVLKSRMIDSPGELRLTDLHVREGGGTILWIPAKTIVSLLKKKGNQIQVRFRVQGDMNDPQFDLQESLLTRMAISLAEELGIPIKVVGEKMIEGTIKGSGGLVESLKSIEELFKKKKKGR